MTSPTPTDPDALRAEIVQTRTDLGNTVEALAAKMDVKARTKDAVTDLTDQVKDKVRDVRDQARGLLSTAAGQASNTASTLGDQVRSNIADVRESLADGDVVAAVRKPLPIVGIAVTAAVVGLVIYLIRQARS
jgi:ABC-type transporter Mla subunit MlaD